MVDNSLRFQLPLEERRTLIQAALEARRSPDEQAAVFLIEFLRRLQQRRARQREQLTHPGGCPDVDVAL